MTAIWGIQGTTPDDKQVSLTFYSGPSAPAPNYVRLLGFVDDDPNSKRKFKSQSEADEWAASLGVKQWHVVQHTRAFPEASNIPISFSEAPNDDQLHKLIAELEAGAKLDDLVDGEMVEHDGHQFQATPGLLRLWLIGVAPNHPTLQRFKQLRKRT